MFTKKAGRIIWRSRPESGGARGKEVDLESLMEILLDRPVSLFIGTGGGDTGDVDGTREEAGKEDKNDQADWLQGYHHAERRVIEYWKDLKFGVTVSFIPHSHVGLSAPVPIHLAPEYENDAGDSRVDSNADLARFFYTLYQSFNPSSFSAGKLAELFANAGCRYVLIAAKSRDGFCSWDTSCGTKVLKRDPRRFPLADATVEVEGFYSIKETPFKDDLVALLVEALQDRGLEFGFRFSNEDWNDPCFRWDPNNRSFDPGYNREVAPSDWEYFIDKHRTQLRELLTRYSGARLLSLEGQWPAEGMGEFVSTLKLARELQPGLLICNQVVPEANDYQELEACLPESACDENIRGPWQAKMSWGTSLTWRPWDDSMAKEWLLESLVETVAKGGNFLLELVPGPTGEIPEDAVDALVWIGKWLEVNGEAIYGSRPWHTLREEDFWFTRSKDVRTVYAIHFGWPGGEHAIMSMRAKPGSNITILGIDKPLEWDQDAGYLSITIPDDLREMARCEHAFVLRIPIR